MKTSRVFRCFLFCISSLQFNLCHGSGETCGPWSVWESCPDSSCSKIRTKECTQTCDEDYWSPWSSWTSCSQSCAGSRSRSRHCIIGDCTTGPSACAGDDSETQSCSENNQVILITAYNQAEVYIPFTGEMFHLPSIPDNLRVWHTLTGNVLCGGVDPNTSSSCLELTQSGAGWQPYSTGLDPPRMAHSAWSSPEGIVLLGGHFSPTTTQLVTSSNTSPGFSLKSDTSYACAISDGDRVVLTGGFPHSEEVSVYNLNGFLRFLPSLNEGREYHACASFKNQDDQITFLVAGGFNGFENLLSTEILTKGASAWSVSASLPRARNGQRATNVNNIIYILGGDTEILKFDSSEESWTVQAQMTEKAGTKLEVSTVNCDLVHPYIMDPPSTSSFTPTTTGTLTAAPTTCPPGWSQFEEHCYKYFDNSMSWKIARSNCMEQEGDLASIHSKEENDFLIEITGGTNAVWVGGRRSCSSCKDFKWSDGTQMDFTAWHKVQPDNYGGTEGCMEINWQDGWNDVNCDRSDRGRYVCKKERSSNTMTGSTFLATSSSSLFASTDNMNLISSMSTTTMTTTSTSTTITTPTTTTTTTTTTISLDEGDWIKVFSHDVSGGLFKSDEEALSTNSDDSSALLFSKLDQLERFRRGDGKFHFKIVFPGLGGSNEWLQTSNPATSAIIEGYKSVHLDYALQGDSKPWGGLAQCPNQKNVFICDAPTTRFSRSVRMCVGCQGYTISPGAIPGPFLGPYREDVTRLELYVQQKSIQG